MVKFLVPVCMALGVVAFTSAPAQAGPLTVCNISGTDAIGNDLLTCDASEAEADAGGGSVSTTDPFPTPDWFTPSYAILYADAGFTIATDVVSFTSSGGSDILTLYTDGHGGFAAALATALLGT